MFKLVLPWPALKGFLDSQNEEYIVEFGRSIIETASKYYVKNVQKEVDKLLEGVRDDLMSYIDQEVKSLIGKIEKDYWGKVKVVALNAEVKRELFLILEDQRRLAVKEILETYKVETEDVIKYFTPELMRKIRAEVTEDILKKLTESVK